MKQGALRSLLDHYPSANSSQHKRNQNTRTAPPLRAPPQEPQGGAGGGGGGGSSSSSSRVLSSTQQRLCLYHAEANVPFEAHTDTTFVTLIPCSAIAGLEVWTEVNGWVRPEEHAGCCHEDTVIVMPGEFLHILTAGLFRAAVHRVTRFNTLQQGKVDPPSPPPPPPPPPPPSLSNLSHFVTRVSLSSCPSLHVCL